MAKLYQEITAKGLQISPAFCKLANLSGEAVVEIYDGKIEIKPIHISQKEVKKIANRYIILNLGDALRAGNIELNQEIGAEVWQVEIINQVTNQKRGELYLSADSGAVLRFEEVE